MSRLQRFEERYLYRVGRGFPAAAGAIAGGLFVCAVGLVLYTVIPARKPTPPMAAQIPPEVAVTSTDVTFAIKTAPAPRVRPESATEAYISPGARAVAIALHELRGLMPAPAYTWRDVYESVCSEWYFGYCIARERRIAAKGVSGTIVGVLDMYDEPNTGAEEVELKEVKASYTVNGSNDAKKVAVLKEAGAIIASVPVADRGRHLRAWATIRQDKESARQEQIAAEQARVVREAAAEEQRYSQEKLEKATNRLLAATVGGYSIAVTCFVALALALLAIERNTRQLRSVVAISPTKVVAAERVESGSGNGLQVLD